MADYIDRQAAINACLIGKSDGLPTTNAACNCCAERIKALPSVQPENKPIQYRECADAMLKMWMDNVLTDGEYNKTMDRLNAKWRVKHERLVILERRPE